MAATVLVVDDEETARMVISEFLRSKGYEVLEAGTLADARAVISEGCRRHHHPSTCVYQTAMDPTSLTETYPPAPYDPAR